MQEVPGDDQFPTNDPGPAESRTIDPFHPEAVGITSAITLMRIYDVVMAQFLADYPESARRLLQIHASGGLMGPPPGFDPSQTRRYDD
jgi:hypothetical protein